MILTSTNAIISNYIQVVTYSYEMLKNTTHNLSDYLFKCSRVIYTTLIYHSYVHQFEIRFIWNFLVVTTECLRYK